MDDEETPTRRVDRWLARGAGVTTGLAVVTLVVSLLLGVEAVATTAAPYYALVGPVVGVGTLVVVAMLARGMLAVTGRSVAGRRSTGTVSLLRAVAFVTELGVVAAGAATVGWGFGMARVLSGPGVAAPVPDARVVYGLFGLFVLVVGSLPVYFRAARRARGTE